MSSQLEMKNFMLLNAIIPTARNYIAYWREYPDMFIGLDVMNI